jgi:non-ribosomal peptide synthetase component F
MMLLAVWGSVLSSWSGVTDMVIVSPFSGRTHPGSESAIGCLFSSLLIRFDLSDYPGFPDVLRRVRSAAARASQLQDYPYAEFSAQFRHAPVIGYYSSATPVHFPGLESESFDLPLKLVDDLEVPGSNLGIPHLFIFDHHEGPMRGLLAFNEAAFDRATVEQLNQDLLHFLQDVC